LKGFSGLRASESYRFLHDFDQTSISIDFCDCALQGEADGNFPGLWHSASLFGNNFYDLAHFKRRRRQLLVGIR
jgi:hypothetical protein